MHATKKTRRIPTRTCIGCRVSEDVTHLVRFVTTTAPEDTRSVRRVVQDAQGLLPGRGAWTHRNPDCLHKALTKGGFHRAFKAQVDLSEVHKLMPEWQQKTHTESGSKI